MTEKNLHRLTFRYWLIVSSIFVFSLVADLTTKAWAQNHLQHRPQKKVALIEGWLDLTYTRNAAGAWGLMKNMKKTVRHAVLITLSVLSIGVLGVLTIGCPPNRWLAGSALAAIVGGAVGNLIDRCRWGYVIDFIDWHKGLHWPIFNIADVTITFGVVVLAVLVAIDRKMQHPAVKEPERQNTEHEEPHETATD